MRSYAAHFHDLHKTAIRAATAQALPIGGDRQSKSNISSRDKQTSLYLLFRYLAARHSGLVEAEGLEPATSRM